MFPDYLSVSYDNSFHISVKNRAAGDNGKILNGHIAIKITSCAKKFGMNLTWKKMFCYYLMFLKSLLTHA